MLKLFGFTVRISVSKIPFSVEEREIKLEKILEWPVSAEPIITKTDQICQFVPVEKKRGKATALIWFVLYID